MNIILKFDSEEVASSTMEAAGLSIGSDAVKFSGYKSERPDMSAKFFIMLSAEEIPDSLYDHEYDYSEPVLAHDSF